MKRVKWLLPAIVVAAGFSGLLLTAGCSSTTRHKWLTVFFDGVPGPGEGTNGPPVAPGGVEVAADQTSKPAPAPPEPFYYAHPPYLEQKCASCHESQAGQGMKKKTPDLCFDCHKDFLASMKSKHQPVESGDCKSCHDPHQSYTNKKLLLKTGKDLCFDCHDNFFEKAQSRHQPAENGECLSCHNPHATDVKKLLVKPDGKLCFDCHEDIEKKVKAAKVVHQPVDNGECSSCHNPHASAKKKLVIKSAPTLCWDCHDNFLEKATFKHDVVEDCTTCHGVHQSSESKLLLKPSGALCLDCHEEKDLKAVNGHVGAEGKSCVQCHDPHVGRDKFLLKATAGPGAAPKKAP